MATPTEHTFVGVCDEQIPVSYGTLWQCNKLGGRPDWMYASCCHPACIACGDLMYQVAQLYCPLEGSAFHRTIYIFTCVRKTCLNRRESWRVFRCQLPVTTSPGEGAKQSIHETPKDVAMAVDTWCEDADDWGSESDEEDCLRKEASSLQTNSMQIGWDSEPAMEPHQSQASASCENVGLTEQAHMSNCKLDRDCRTKDAVAMATHTSADVDLTPLSGTSRETTENVAASATSVVCSRSSLLEDNDSSTSSFRQAEVDATKLPASHQRASKNVDPCDAMKSLTIDTQTPGRTQEPDQRLSSSDPPFFKAYFVSVFEEPSSCSSATELTSHERQLMSEYQQREGVDLLEWQEQSLQSPRTSSSTESYEKAKAKHGDKVFQRFAKRLQLCPEQCIRYCWNGSPLYLTAPSEGGVIPSCLYCGGPRVYELQLIPALISVLHDVTKPDATLDFGVVIVYTCKASCWRHPSQPGQPHLREAHVVFQADPDSLLITQATSLVGTLPRDVLPVTE